MTPQESLDFLLKGLKLESSDAETIRTMMSEKGQEIRGNFPDFIAGMRKQNEGRTVAEIWDAADADSFTKMALQWKIQEISRIEMNGSRRNNFDSIKKEVGPVVEDLKKLDELLKKLKGAEVFLQYGSPFGNVFDWNDFSALIIPDGKGVDFQLGDPNNSYREVFLNGHAAYEDRKEYKEERISVTSHLMIPSKFRRILFSTDAEGWEDDKKSFGGVFQRTHEFPFNPDNPFPGIITGKELAGIDPGDYRITRLYKLFKKALQQSSKGAVTKALPQ